MRAEKKYLQTKSYLLYRVCVSENPIPKHRSGCPVSVSLDVFGDRWSLLVIRDLMVRGYRTFREFQQAGEGIATNILADRLRKLQDAKIINAESAMDDGRSEDAREPVAHAI